MHNSPSTSQILTKKLLRSIKRRQLRQTNGENTTPQNKRDMLRRKLNFHINRRSMNPNENEVTVVSNSNKINSFA